MKDKPVSHKNQNTFRFIPFTERISKINIDVIHQISKASAAPEEVTTYFLQTFEKWSDLNYSQDYGELQKEIGSEIRNLKEIVFRQHDIIEILLKFLKRENSLALDAVLELTVALARDLQHDFYPHFPKFFSAIVLHLSTKDTELLEKLFTCLAYLFKFLWKYMIKDIENVYRLFSSLLSEENKEHIRIFAVESFAFLIRRIRAKKTFFLFIFDELEKNPKQSSGVGHLFFEIVKGVKEHFHSCTEEVLKLLLQLLEKEDCNLIEESLKYTVTFMTRHTVQKNNCLIVQKVFCDVIGELIEGRVAAEDSVAKHLDRVLHLFLIWVSHKDGALVSPDSLITKLLMDLCKLSCLPIFCLKSVAEIVSSVLLSDCLALTQDKVNCMIEQIYSSPEEVFLHFNKKVIKYKMFEKDILPHLLSACLRLLRRGDGSEKLALHSLAETVVSLRPAILHEKDIETFTKLYMCFPSKDVTNENLGSCYDVFEKFLLQVISVENVCDSDLSELWSALVCLPHLRNLKVQPAAEVLQKLMLSLKTHLLSEDTDLNHHKAEKYGFVLYQAYVVYLIISKDFSISLPSSFYLSLLKKYSRCVSILRLVDLHFAVSKNAFGINVLMDFLPCVITNLASPLHLVRFFTLKILDKFSCCFNQDNQDFSVFSICFEAEKVPLDVQSYREKLKWIRKLEHEFIAKQFIAEFRDSLEKVPIYYLIGTLFVNFRLLWEPALNVLETYAHGTVKNFWDVFGQHLYRITEMCEKNDFLFEELHESEDSDLPFTRCFTEFCRSGENPDVGNHRVLLWKAMEKFPDVAESKNRMIVPLLFKLMSNEVVKVDNSVAVKEGMSKESFSTSQVYEGSVSNRTTKRRLKKTYEQSNKRKCTVAAKSEEEVVSDAAKHSLEREIDSEDDDDEEEDDLCSESEEINDNIPSAVKKTKGWNERKFSVAKALAAYLTVFSKFKNPKALYKTEELQNLYSELLSYHNPVIQKLSFDCLLTYNYKHIMPYKDHFYRILDNKTFKNEIVLFSLDTENAVIEKEHRKEALAVLMRILYGKMLYQTGSKTTGKSLANTRRSLVLRFLAGCTAEELKMFFELAFLPYLELMKDNTLEAVKKIRVSLDLANIVPLRRQHSALNSLGLIFQHLGNLVPELLPWLLKLLLIILATSTTLLEKREEVLPHCINILKSIRTLAVMKLIQFFESFPKYNFHPEEIDAIFESFVWTMLPRLKLESVNQPSPLVRLFSAWSENSRYFILFSKHHEESESLSPLPHVIELYSSLQAKPRVVGAIAKIIFRLVSVEDCSDSKEVVTPLQINNSLCLEDKTNEENNSYGIKLLLPYINSILKRLEMTIFAVAKKKSKKSLSLRDLTILLRISPYVEDSEQSSKLVSLLVPFLMKPNSDADMEILILNSIKNLIPKVEDSASLIKLLPPLFGKLSSINSRSALVDVFSTAAESTTEISCMVEIIKKINAFDREMMEEPDYQQRLDGHKEAIELIRNMSGTLADEDFMRIIVFNCAFDIKTYADIALRNSSSKLLQDVARIASNFQDSDTKLFSRIVLNTLLPEIQDGLKCSDELQRHEFISVLSTVLHSCKHQPQLKELASLCHEDKDLDFWENLKHLQVHRRARALLRFSESLRLRREGGERVDPQHLQAYIIPILKTFLFDDAYKKHVHVIDAAIETLGTVASVLSWQHYELLLRQYLQLITKDAQHHKTVVKIVVSLLNAFPFNLKEVKVATAESNEIEESVRKEPLSLYDLTPEMGNKISRSIRKNILPLLHQSLMKKSKNDDEHKLAGSYYPEDEEILRVPIALAMVKLLQKMPTGSLEKALPGIFLRMCDLLKSRTESIRETTRETLIKMMQCLGPRYFHFLLREMRAVMKRGYQVHVMIFTINAVLLNIVDQLSAGDLDDSLKDLVEICVEELFSNVAEEKEVAKITGKLKEARHVKSYSIFKVLSKFVSETLLADLLLPLKEELDLKHSHKSVGKIADCLRNIALGLSENAGVSEQGLLQFVHCLVSQNIPSVKKNKAPIQGLKYERADSYLLPQEPGRSGPPAKISGKTNHHVLVEFGLQILHFCLKKEKINKRDLDFLKMLDPFVQLLSDCLSSNHIKIISTALRCLLPLYQHPLPSFKTCTKKIVNSLFILINKYAGPGMARGENFEMIVMCFKTMTVLVRETSYHSFSEDECHSLLSYVEQDIFDSCRQATAFSLLKAILTKRMISPELAGIMSRIAEMSITSEQDHIRAQCRQLCMQYMLDYPLGKKLDDTIAFFNKQLEYPHEDGRRSCIEIINSMISMFPDTILKKHSTVFLLHLSMRLVNDESSHCRKMSTECLGELLRKVDHDGRAVLFPVVFQLLQEKKMPVKRVAAQVCGLFAEVEGEKFEHHLLEILPVYIELLKDTAYQKTEKEPDKRCADHFLYHLLNSLTKMLSCCCVLRKPQYSSLFNKFWEDLQGVLLYPHIWVRLAASHLFGLLFSSYSVEEMSEAVLHGDALVFVNSVEKLRSLSTDFCTQIQSIYLNDSLGEQIVRNLVFLGKVMSLLPELDESDLIGWMIKRMCREARKEVTEASNISLRRKYVFMFIAAIAHEIGREKLVPHLCILLAPLCREIADASKYIDESLRKTAQEVLDLIQNVVGVEEFSKQYASAQSALLKKKTEKKRKKTQDAVKCPEKFAKRKIKKQLKKKESNKRKLLQQKGRRKVKKQKLSDIVIAS